MGNKRAHGELWIRGMFPLLGLSGRLLYQLLLAQPSRLTAWLFQWIDHLIFGLSGFPGHAGKAECWDG